jgi:hypothetical protein
MDTEERSKWLKWSKIGICVPLQSKESTTDSKELNVETTLERLLKRQEEMQTNFYNYLRDEKSSINKNQKRKMQTLSTKREQCFGSGETSDISKPKWFRL